MKASKFTDSQKAFIIRQGDEGTAVAEICRKAGISQATYFNWKKKYSGMMPSESRNSMAVLKETPGNEPESIRTRRARTVSSSTSSLKRFILPKRCATR